MLPLLWLEHELLLQEQDLCLLVGSRCWACGLDAKGVLATGFTDSVTWQHLACLGHCNTALNVLLGRDVFNGLTTRRQFESSLAVVRDDTKPFLVDDDSNLLLRC